MARFEPVPFFILDCYRLLLCVSFFICVGDHQVQVLGGVAVTTGHGGKGVCPLILEHAGCSVSSPHLHLPYLGLICQAAGKGHGEEVGVAHLVEGWLAGYAGWLAIWFAGWLVGWLAGLLADCLARLIARTMIITVPRANQASNIIQVLDVCLLSSVLASTSSSLAGGMAMVE